MNNVDNVSTGLEKENSTSFLLQKQCDNYFSQGNPSIINKALKNLKSLNALFANLTLVSILSFCLFIFSSLSKSLKSYYVSLKSVNKVKFFSKDSIPTENQNDLFFVLRSFCNLGYIGQTRR